MNTAKISLCMIVKNEEKYLKRCVDSVSDLVDEVIIVDTGSSDETINIASQLTKKVYKKEFNGNFAEMRNYAINQAQNDWILFLDADEFFYPNEVMRIQKLFSKGIPDKIGGIEFNAYNFFNTGGWFTSHVLRIFRNNRGFHYERAVGERIVNSILSAGYEIMEPDIILTHTGYCKSSEYRFKKMENYIAIAQKQIEENSKDYTAYAYKGINLRNNGFLTEAFKYTKIAVEGDPNSFVTQNFFGSVARSLNKNQLAIDAYYKAEQLAPTKMKSIMKNIRGVIVLSQGRYNEALTILEEAYHSNPDLIHILVNIGITKYFLGQYSEALLCFEKVLERNPTFGERQDISYFKADPFQSMTYETIYGYPGLQHFINSIKCKEAN